MAPSGNELDTLVKFPPKLEDHRFKFSLLCGYVGSLPAAGKITETIILTRNVSFDAFLYSLEARTIGRILPLLARVVLTSRVNISAPKHGYSEDQSKTPQRSACRKKWKFSELILFPNKLKRKV